MTYHLSLPCSNSCLILNLGEGIFLLFSTVVFGNLISQIPLSAFCGGAQECVKISDAREALGGVL